MIPLRDENPTHSFPLVTVLLIVANVVVFIFQSGLGPGAQAFVFNYGVIPYELAIGANLPSSTAMPPFASILTSMFLHGGIMHLVGNMWFLWIFGDNIEDFLGHFRFGFFYLATGLVATFTHIAFNLDSQVPLVGASGAISGVLGAYFLLHPKIRIVTLLPLGLLFTTIQVPAVIFLGIWMLMQFSGVFSVGSNVAYGAHIGGFVAGLLLILVMSRKDPGHHRRYQPSRVSRRRW